MTTNPREPVSLEAPAPVPPSFDEFYIGYAPPMPPHIARYVKRAVLTIAAGVPLAASLIALGHVRLDGGTFDYGRPLTIAGVIAAHPYPSIRFDPPFTRSTSGGEAAGSRWALLVAPGKHGAGALATPFDGQRVTLDATRIQRGNAVMFEVAPGTIAADPAASAADTSSPGTSLGGTLSAGKSLAGTSLASTSSTGNVVAPEAAAAGTSSREGTPVTLRGEIVDSKCFLGVMVPGDGKTHKDCASLCLRGGIPPALVVRDREGRSALLLLVSESGGSLAGHPAASRFAGEPIELTGVIEDELITPSEARDRERGWRLLRTNPSTWRPLAPPAR
jgi:hypothetical protein